MDFTVNQPLKLNRGKSAGFFVIIQDFFKHISFSDYPLISLLLHQIL